MKRVATEESNNASKRSRGDGFDPSLQRNITDIANAGPNLIRTGFIAGTVVMRWPLAHQLSLNLQTQEGRSSYRFNVDLSGACLRYFEKLAILPGEGLQIALRGVEVLQTKPSAGPNSYPVVLKYKEGVCVKFVTRIAESGNALIVDTWERAWTDFSSPSHV